MNIGPAIRHLRRERNMTLRELSEKSGVSLSYISLVERGKRNPVILTLQDLANGLNIPLPVLLFKASAAAELGISNRAKRATAKAIDALIQVSN